jgi:hypothetical protein
MDKSVRTQDMLTRKRRAIAPGFDKFYRTNKSYHGDRLFERHYV